MEWKEIKFGDVIEFPPRITCKKGDYYPFILMDKIESQNKFVKAEEEKEYSGSGSKFSNGDILFARITPSLDNRKIAIAKLEKKQNAFGSTELFVFRAKEGISDQGFIYYLSKTDLIVQNAINSYVGASGRQRADANFVKSIKLRLPPLPIQKKIAGILSAYDDLIENNNRRIELLEKAAQNIYKEWFVRMRFPGYQSAKYQENGLPEGWEVKKLGEKVVTQYGYTASSEIENIGPKFLRITDIVPNTINWQNVPHCQISNRESEKYLLSEGDILVARTGATVGYAKRINKYHPESVFASYLVRLKCKKISENILIGLAVESSNFKNFINMVTTGAAQPMANASIMSLFKIKYPTENILNQFNKIIEPIIDLKERLYQKNEKLRTARNRLLPKLVSGKLSVEHLADV